MNKKKEDLLELQELKDLHSYFSNQYYKELERKDGIYTSLINQSTIIVALMTILVIIFNPILVINTECRLILLIFFIASFIAVAYSSFLTITALFGYEYFYIGEASKFFEYWKNSKDSNEISEYYYKTIKRLCEINDKNFEVNKLRIEKRVKAYKMIKASMFIIFTLLVLFIVISFRNL